MARHSSFQKMLLATPDHASVFDRIRALQAAGKGITHIARIMCLSRPDVRKYLA